MDKPDTFNQHRYADLTIGDVHVTNGVLLAPMEDVTDLPFRVICKRMGADIVYTEFISSDGLIRDARRSIEKLRLFLNKIRRYNQGSIFGYF